MVENRVDRRGSGRLPLQGKAQIPRSLQSSFCILDIQDIIIRDSCRGVQG